MITSRQQFHWFKEFIIIFAGMVLARKDGIAHWRRVLGPTKVSDALKKSPNSIRATFGDPHRCVMSISALKKTVATKNLDQE